MAQKCLNVTVACWSYIWRDKCNLSRTMVRLSYPFITWSKKDHGDLHDAMTLCEIRFIQVQVINLSVTSVTHKHTKSGTLPDSFDLINKIFQPASTLQTSDIKTVFRIYSAKNMFFHIFFNFFYLFFFRLHCYYANCIQCDTLIVNSTSWEFVCSCFGFWVSCRQVLEQFLFF